MTLSIISPWKQSWPVLRALFFPFGCFCYRTSSGAPGWGPSSRARLMPLGRTDCCSGIPHSSALLQLTQSHRSLKQPFFKRKEKQPQNQMKDSAHRHSIVIQRIYILPLLPSFSLRMPVFAVAFIMRDGHLLGRQLQSGGSLAEFWIL